MTAIELYSGAFLDLADPDPAAIELTDIARGLSQICRYTGQCKRFYSVAEHAVLVAVRLGTMGASQEVQLAGLHHDDAEAFLGDVSRPLKELLPDYQTLEFEMTLRIEAALGLPFVLPEERAWIKAADDWALMAEAYKLMPSKGQRWNFAPFDPDEQNVPTWFGCEPDEAAKLYLGWHEMLSS